MNMPKANQNNILISLLIISLAWLAACTNPEATRRENLLVATELKEIGDYDGALVKLEILRAQSPQDVEVLELIGQVYLLKNDNTMAALFYEQAHEQSPQDIALLKQTIEILISADEPAAHLLEKLVDLDSSALSSELWTKLAQYRMAEKQIQGSLQAYLKSVPEKVSQTDSSTATALGRLFLLLDNPSQAEYWFKNATNSQNIDALDALFGLLEIKLSNSNWAHAEEVIAQLDERFPGAIDASDWAKARKQLQHWKDALATTKANLNNANKFSEEALTNVHHYNTELFMDQRGRLIVPEGLRVDSNFDSRYLDEVLQTEITMAGETLNPITSVDGVGVVKDADGNQVLSSNVFPVTNYQYEVNENDAKR